MIALMVLLLLPRRSGTFMLAVENEGVSNDMRLADEPSEVGVRRSIHSNLIYE